MRGFIIVFIFSFIFYRFFLSTNPLIANDWPLLFRESRDFSPFWAIAWDYMGGGGLGSPAFKTLWIDLYTNLTYAISNLINLPWWLSQRIFWVVPFIVISICSSYRFASLFVKTSFFRLTSSILYTFNTYILLIVGGGQFGIAFAYGLSPLVLFVLFRFLKETNIRNVIFAGLLSGILIALDPRVAFLTFLIAVILCLFFMRDFYWRKFGYIVLNFAIAAVLNTYWILPSLLFQSSFAGLSSYTSLEGVKFLSFANFSNSLALLHPNWPENIFGKTYFFKPEFLILPILAFSVFLTKFKKELLFFAGLSIIAAFLGKGANEPFGEFYLLLFQVVPGFNLFRDSTKFFILIAISYSILVPYFLEKVSFFKYFFVAIFFAYWLSLLKPGWTGELNGIFKPTEIPSEYQFLKNKLKSDQFFYRTLWLPKRHKYGYFDNNHPAAEAEVLIGTSNVNKILKNLDAPHTQNYLSQLSIKYLIVPYDSQREIFLKDRKYDEKQYKNAIEKLKKITRLKQLDDFEKIAVFEVLNPKDHFWIEGEDIDVHSKTINPTYYQIKAGNGKIDGLLVFSEGFDKNWIAKSNGKSIRSVKFGGHFNSFKISDSNSIEVYYMPQQWVNRGLIISSISFFACISSLLFFWLKGKYD